MSNRNRTKGHNFERETAKLFRELGYTFAKTSRQASRLLDDCGVDISGVPYLVQCKAGYHRGLKHETIFTNMRKRLKENYPPEDPIHLYPMMIFHKIDGRKPEKSTVIMKHKEFMSLLEELEAYKSTIKKVRDYCESNNLTICQMISDELQRK